MIEPWLEALESTLRIRMLTNLYDLIDDWSDYRFGAAALYNGRACLVQLVIGQHKHKHKHAREIENCPTATRREKETWMKKTISNCDFRHMWKDFQKFGWS